MLLLLLTLAACQPAARESGILSIAIEGGDVAMGTGDSLALIVDVQMDRPGDDTVLWSSSAESVATVAASGLVTAVGPGSATITAAARADPGKQDSIEVLVAPSGDVLWTRQLGGPNFDLGLAVAVDPDGYAYVAGSTTGSVFGPDAGAGDAFVVKYSQAGEEVWTRQFGTASADRATSLAIDPDGNLFVAGETRGNLAGMQMGVRDGFVRMYDPDGAVLWTRQFGTSEEEFVYGAAADSGGNVYVVGATGGDAYVQKFNAGGDIVWNRQFGSASSDGARGVAVDEAGNVIVTGLTFGTISGVSAGDYDAFVRIYSPAGSVIWTRQFGTPELDMAVGVATDQDGNIVVAGITAGALAGASTGGADAFVRKYSPVGGIVWTRQFGTGFHTDPYAIATDPVGNIHVVGFTNGALVGEQTPGIDAYVRSYAPAGDIGWTRQVSAEGSTEAHAVAAHAGSVFVAGRTTGVLGESNLGGTDAFVRRYAR